VKYVLKKWNFLNVGESEIEITWAIMQKITNVEVICLFFFMIMPLLAFISILYNFNFTSVFHRGSCYPVICVSLFHVIVFEF